MCRWVKSKGSPSRWFMIILSFPAANLQKPTYILELKKKKNSHHGLLFAVGNTKRINCNVSLFLFLFLSLFSSNPSILYNWRPTNHLHEKNKLECIFNLNSSLLYPSRVDQLASAPPVPTRSPPSQCPTAGRPDTGSKRSSRSTERKPMDWSD